MKTIKTFFKVFSVTANITAISWILSLIIFFVLGLFDIKFEELQKAVEGLISLGFMASFIMAFVTIMNVVEHYIKTHDEDNKSTL